MCLKDITLTKQGNSKKKKRKKLIRDLKVKTLSNLKV